MNSLYLDLLRRVLTRSLFLDHPQQKRIRELGRDWPVDAETMIGDERLENIELLGQVVLRQLAHDRPIRARVQGDFMECGVWRGGAAIFMRALIAQYESDQDLANLATSDAERSVWVADSFQGLPVPSPEQYPADTGDKHHEQAVLSISQADVEANFRRYGLLDDRVKFLPGFFKDSLPGPVKQLALLRIDADMYESTTQALEAMYPLLSPGGFVIVDDYHNIRNAHLAVDDFRQKYGVAAPLQNADSWCAVYWRKP